MARAIGDRVAHIEDGMKGTVQAFWIVFDDGTAMFCDDSVLTEMGPNGEFVAGCLK